MVLKVSCIEKQEFAQASANAADVSNRAIYQDRHARIIIVARRKISSQRPDTSRQDVLHSIVPCSQAPDQLPKGVAQNRPTVLLDLPA
jgi:hypothetical protein